MSDDLVKRLRATCSCNIDNTPCLAEEECRVAQEAADRIEEYDRAFTNLHREYDARGERIAELEAACNQSEAMALDYATQVKELEAKLVKAAAMALEECPFRWGTKSYNDWWQDRRTTLAKLTGGKDEWWCPIGYEGCTKNCGGYGCGN